MHRRGSKEEDSGSDWDSMSEIGPPPPPMKLNSAPVELENAPVTREAPVDVKSPKDNPPYDFRNEVRSPPLNASEHLVKPGKQRKGRTYDPVSGTPKHVTFAGDQEPPHGLRTEVRVSTSIPPESDSEDPLYSTVKPKNQKLIKGNNSNSNNNKLGITAQPQTQTANKSKKATKNPAKFSHKPLEGIDNHGFVEDNSRPSEPSIMRSTNAHRDDQISSSPQLTLKTPLPKLSECVSECEVLPQSHHHHSYSTMANNNTTIAKECAPPLILTSGEALLESAGKRPVEAVNRALGEAFALITIPLTCFILFIHHLLRFFLLGLVRPIFVDSLRLMIEYLVQPFITGVMKPLLMTVHVASVSLSETMLVCVRPLTSVLRSIRLVEVHYTSRYSVEDI